MSVSVATAPAFLAGTPETLFESVGLRTAWGRSYDVSLDGQRFLITLTKDATTGTHPDDFRAALAGRAEAARADELTSLTPIIGFATHQVALSDALGTTPVRVVLTMRFPPR